MYPTPESYKILHALDSNAKPRVAANVDLLFFGYPTFHISDNTVSQIINN
jgi:hypothetical protein